jgi:hypothetical protein
MTKRTSVLAASTVLCLALLLAALALTSAWPFAGSSDPKERRHVVWQGDVTLREDALYALDLLPVVPLRACSNCLSITSRGTLNAPNGIQGWPGKHRPSFIDCILLRNKEGTLNSVILGVQHKSIHGVAVHGWLCATGGGNDGFMRMQFNGHEGVQYHFTVTSWGRPAEG